MMPSGLILSIIIGVIALCLLLISLRLSYQLGRRTNERISSLRFDKMPARIQLDNTEWIVEYTDIDSVDKSRKIRGWIKFQQTGPRIVGTGEDESGQVWSAEGITFGDKLAYLYSDRNQSGRTLGSVQVELSADLSELNGLRSIWAGNSNSLMMQPIKLIHIDSQTNYEDEFESSETSSTYTPGNGRSLKTSIHESVLSD